MARLTRSASHPKLIPFVCAALVGGLIAAPLRAQGPAAPAAAPGAVRPTPAAAGAPAAPFARAAAFARPTRAASPAPSTRPDLARLQWRSVGPYVGGRVVAIAGVPGRPDLFYMGGVDAGIWKSTDYGLSWKNISDNTLPGSSNSIGALAVAPSNPAVIYAGTGEADIRGDMITGDGVFRSDDGGKTWKAAGLADTHTTMALAVDPRNTDVVYAASMGHVFVPGAHRGVFKTTDGGKTWQKVLFVNDSTGAVSLSMDPKNPDVLYAATWQAYRKHFRLSSGGAGSGIYKTTDGGAHWTNISGAKGLPQETLGKIGVAVAPSSPNVVYAVIQAKDGGVFRSDDSGQTWTPVNDDWKLRQRAFYYMAITVNPQNPNTVYMPQVDAVYASRDGGRTFKRVHTPHGDNHIIWVNPNDTTILLEGNDGGATVSTDGGRTWSTEHNQPTGQFYHVNLDHRFPFHIYG
ncbi:MAG TPA: YCF48-related protein, partial [Longimicrobiales bacterium]|nr:YCF48-related protein [Longimicrobiales bacterium]